MLSVWAILIFGSCIGTVLSDPCPNQCSGYGRCTGQVCECFDGHQGGDCSEFICPFGRAWADIAEGVDDAHNLAECSNMGHCDRTLGQCSCQFGFGGKACDRRDCPVSCSGQGRCQSMKFYAQSKDPGFGTIYTYTDIWDADMMWGCHCDDGFYGADCSQRACPSGDDPMTGTGVSTTANPTQFNAIQRVSCKAGGGTFTLSFGRVTTAKIDFNAPSATLQTAFEALPNIGVGNIAIVMTDSQACTELGTSFTLEFLQNFGSIPMIQGDSSLLTFADAVNVPSIAVAHQVVGSKEDISCSGRGTCDSATGYCTCSTNYDTSNGYNEDGTRGDCGNALQTIQVCPGLTSCSGHGYCSESPKYACSCAEGWTSGDCSERLCPTAVSWFTRPEADDFAHVNEQVECGDMGVCDRTIGVCICVDGFTGSACERLACPGIMSECNGNGRCQTMKSLAGLATVNGDPAGFTYGATPNNPITWDAEKVYGCQCDEGWHGYDCTLHDCPRGDDPLTHDQYDEVQLLTCRDADLVGSVIPSFRGHVAASPVPATATCYELQTALSTIVDIGVVTVSLLNSSETDSLCTTTGESNFLVTFNTLYGNMPLLRFENMTGTVVDSLNVTEHVVGTKEDLECSGRGLCVPASGICNCFTGYGSSDGLGGVGTTGDCSYIIPIAVAAAA